MRTIMRTLKRPPRGGLFVSGMLRIGHTMCARSLLHADCLDLLFSVGLGLESHRSNLDPGCFGRTGFNDLALLRGLLLDYVVVGAGRGHQKSYGGCRES